MSSIRTSRRKFLGKTMALGSACMTPSLIARAADGPAVTICKPLVDDARLRTRQNLAVFVQDRRKLESFRAGVDRMRRMPPDHPFSWIFQANIHQRPLFPAYVYQQAAASLEPDQQLFRDDLRFSPCPNVFNQCTHANWWFVAWHRAYLFFFERILRWASGNEHLTIPYWNWADPGQRQLPQAFREPTVNGVPNPLYLPVKAGFTDDSSMPQDFPMRDHDLNVGTACLTDVSLCSLTRIRFFNSPPSPADACFGSQHATRPTDSPGQGALETVHGNVHLAIGGPLQSINGQFFYGFMSIPQTSARDPIFWVHHSNIDRLWASWSALDDKRMNPLDSEWLDQKFTFYDVDNGQPKPVAIRVCQLLDTKRQLGYEYDYLSTNLTGCGPPPPPRVQQIVRRLAAVPADFAAPTDTSAIRLNNVDDSSIHIPLVKDVTAKDIQSLAAQLHKQPTGAIVLSLEKIELKQTPDVYFDLYLNLPKERKASLPEAHKIGSLSFFGMGNHGSGHGMAAPPLYLRFAFPQALLGLIADKRLDVDDLELTIVPQTGKKPVGNAVLSPRIKRTSVSIARIQILEMR